ncbi:MAG TPA: tetratricopeptide repeat protein, partial [Gemmataceae bacterium]
MSDTNSLKDSVQTNDETLLAAASTLPATDACASELFECLGVGGMGEVYRCGDDALRRDLAVKILKAELRGDAAAEERFLREARLTGSLQHPGIVPVHYLGRRTDGRPCYTMKLVRGRTLAEMLRQEPAGPERLPHLLAVLEKMCQAMAFAHSKGVIHRDLKPSNVMVGEFGEVQVMDWGLAKELSRDEPASIKATKNAEAAARTDETEELSRTGAVLGTPAYMPPEQAAGDWDIVDERADVFALGAVLCEVLTGRPPYRGVERDEVLQRARHGDLAKALERLEKCRADAALVDLCGACLAAERLQRPRHAGVVAERLAAYQAEVRERLRQAELERARAEVKAREERKRRRLLAALALAGLLMVVGGVAVRRQGQQRRAEADAAVAEELSEARLLRRQAQAEPLAAMLYDKAVSAADKASDMARAGGASESIQRQASDLLAAVKQEAEEAAKDRRLLARLLEARGPHEGPKYRRDDKGTMMALTTPTAEEQFASAFRDWGLDVDAMPTSEAAARLKARPVIRTEVIAALDEWASQRHVDRKPEAEWRRVADLAAALDDDPDSLRRELRAILARGQLQGSADRARLRQLAERTDSAKEPVLGLLTLARSLRMAGEEALAERLLRKALTMRPREVVLYHTLGDLLARQRPAEAVKFYLAARGLRPDLGVALAEALQRSGGEDEALDVLTALVKENPDNPYLHFRQAYALQNKSDLDGAMACYKETLELDPKYALAYNNLGAILCDHKRDYDRAIACFKKAVELNPQFANFHNYLGVALANKGDLDDAIACFKKAIKLEPKNILPHNNLGVALANKGDWDDAIACHKKAIELNPQLAQSHCNLGFTLHNKGDVDGAIACYEKAL